MPSARATDMRTDADTKMRQAASACKCDEVPKARKLLAAARAAFVVTLHPRLDGALYAEKQSAVDALVFFVFLV